MGQFLDVPGTHLRFTTMNPHTGAPRQAIKRNANQLLSQILQPSYHNYISTTGLFYEVLDLPLSELETKKVLKVTWLPDGINTSETYDLLVPKNGQIQDLKEVLQKKLELDDEAMTNVRIFEAHTGRLLKVLTNDYGVLGIADYVDIFAEKIPEDEMNFEDGDRFVHAFHFHKEPVKVHTRGIPFRFVVKNVRITILLQLYFCCLLFPGRNFQANEGALAKADWYEGETV